MAVYPCLAYFEEYIVALLCYYKATVGIFSSCFGDVLCKMVNYQGLTCIKPPGKECDKKGVLVRIFVPVRSELSV
jgi:hypothetical protein